MGSDQLVSDTILIMVVGFVVRTGRRKSSILTIKVVPVNFAFRTVVPLVGVDQRMPGRICLFGSVDLVLLVGSSTRIVDREIGVPIVNLVVRIPIVSIGVLYMSEILIYVSEISVVLAKVFELVPLPVLTDFVLMAFRMDVHVNFNAVVVVSADVRGGYNDVGREPVLHRV